MSNLKWLTVLIQSCSTTAKNFTNYVFCHPQFSGVIKILKIVVPFWHLFVYVDYYQNNQFYKVKNFFFKFCFDGTTIFIILDNTTELWMTKNIIGEIFNYSGATLYKDPSDQIVYCFLLDNAIDYLYTHLVVSPGNALAWVYLLIVSCCAV